MISFGFMANSGAGVLQHFLITRVTFFGDPHGDLRHFDKMFIPDVKVIEYISKHPGLSFSQNRDRAAPQSR